MRLAGALLGLLLAAALPAAERWLPGDPEDRVLLVWKPAGRAALAAEARRLGLDGRSGEAKLRSELRARHGLRGAYAAPGLGYERLVLAAPGRAALDAALAGLEASGLVAAVQPDHPVKAAALALDDPLYTGGFQWNLAQTDWPAAVAAYNGGEFALRAQVVVAVLDSGVDAHADLAGQLLGGKGFVAEEPGTDDLHGHGTFVSGLIAAKAGDASGMAGAFFEPALVRILPVKVLNGCGRGYISGLAEGILWAVDQGARILNMSIEGEAGGGVLEEAVAYARRRGSLLVVATGNSGYETGFPARYTQAFAVGSLDHTGAKASYSASGKVDLAAPGGDSTGASCSCVGSTAVAGCAWEVWSLAGVQPGCADPQWPNAACSTPNAYEAGSGTSFAAPLVSAAAALLLSQDPSRSVEELQRILIQSAAPTAYGKGYDPRVGWGRLDFHAALTWRADKGPGSGLKTWSWPNPFTPLRHGVTTIAFTLPEAREAKVRILDAAGDLVRSWTLAPGQAAAGFNQLAWDGRNGAGDFVGNGAYTLVVESGGERTVKALAVLQ